MVRHLVRCATLVLLACLAISAPACAEELQVAFDPAGRIQRVDEPLARRIGLFIEKYPGFQEARLFAADDSTFVLEVSMVRGGQLSRTREVLTREQADELRADVTRRVGSAGPEPARIEQGGRAMLLTGSALLGLGFYGWAVPYVFNVEDGSVALGSYMITAGASYFLPLLLTRNKPVTWGMTNLSLYGMTRGGFHGWLLSEIVKPDGGFDDDGRTAIALTMATSVTEGVLGYAFAEGSGMSAGSAATIMNGGDYGLLWGYLASDLAGFPDRDEDRSTAVTVLGTGVAGMAAGGLLAGHRAYSYGDGMVMRGGGYVGMLLATSIVDAGDPADSKPYSAGLLVGSMAGLFVGDRLVDGREFTAGEGVLVQLGSLAGGLTGLGLVALTNTDDSSPYWFGTSLGSAVGYMLTYRQLSGAATARSSERTSWRFDLAPEGLLAALRRAPGAGAARDARGVPPIARFTCAF